VTPLCLAISSRWPRPQVVEMIQKRPEIPVCKGHIPASFDGEVEMRDITFSYPSRPLNKVLDGFSLAAKAGGSSSPGQLLASSRSCTQGAKTPAGPNRRRESIQNPSFSAAAAVASAAEFALASSAQGRWLHLLVPLEVESRALCKSSFLCRSPVTAWSSC